MIKVVQIVPDDRDVRALYELENPFFGPAPTALFEGFSHLKNEVEVHIVSCTRRESNAPDQLADNIFYHQVAVSQGYSRTFFLEAIRNVVRKIKEINPDLVHGQGTEGYPALAAAFSGYPNCITIHGNMREVAKRQRFSPLFYMVLVSIWELLALKKTDAVFCNSSYTDACVGGLNKNKPRIFNAVRSSFFDLRSKKTEESAPPILLCIGHILPYKNQIALIRALDELPNIGKIKLLFAGSCCPEDEYGRKFLKEVSTRSWCEYAGRLEQKELMDLLSGCDGVIHPTLEDSFGLAVAEAQAAGVPVAASAIGGIPDLIEHEKTGLLFNPHDPEDIRQKVIQLLDQTVTERLSRNARVFAEAEYRPEIIARKQLQLYRDVLGS